MAKRAQNSVEIDKWLKLIRADGIGPVTFAKLLKFFGSIDKILGASANELTKVNGIGPDTAKQIAASRNKFNVTAELELADKLGVWIMHLNDSRYPTVLKRIYDPPPVLYVKGTLTKTDNLAIAIVGSRRCSLYGGEQTGRFAHLLASAGFTIVSGMARGIDSAAHHGALSASGRTIAVQGCGLANIFPPENKKLFELITVSGACISELPLQYEPLAENFPVRNRIIAGLCLGTIVIEAPQRSGALITARAALENNREVMAIPGKIDSPLNRGTHQLIKQGAKLIDSVGDVTEALGYIGKQLQDYVTKSADEAAIRVDTPLFDISKLKLTNCESMVYNCLGADPLHIEDIIEQSDFTPGDINAGLVSLQLKGLVKQVPGNMFLRR